MIIILKIQRSDFLIHVIVEDTVNIITCLNKHKNICFFGTMVIDRNNMATTYF